jgi:hypothetical protein
MSLQEAENGEWPNTNSIWLEAQHGKGSVDGLPVPQDFLLGPSFCLPKQGQRPSLYSISPPYILL